MSRKMVFCSGGVGCRLAYDSELHRQVSYIAGPFECAGPCGWDFTLTFDPEIVSEECHSGCLSEGVRLKVERLARGRVDLVLGSSSLKAVSSAFGFMLAVAVPHHQGVVLHASALKLGRRGFVFCGPSGAGKSTIVMNASGGELIHEDRVVVRRYGHRWMVHSTPQLDNLGNASKPTKDELGGVFLLHKGKRLSLLWSSRPHLLPGLLAQVVCPVERPDLEEACALLGADLLASGRAGVISFSRESNVTEVL